CRVSSDMRQLASQQKRHLFIGESIQTNFSMDRVPAHFLFAAAGVAWYAVFIDCLLSDFWYVFQMQSVLLQVQFFQAVQNIDFSGTGQDNGFHLELAQFFSFIFCGEWRAETN